MKNRVLSAMSALLIIAFSGMDFTALAEKYPLNITATASANEDVAEIRISGVIHEWQNSAQEFKRQIDALIEKGIKNVKLYINTPGGDVFQANEIANEIKRFKGKISGYGGALVASAGSYLAMICDTFEMADNGQYMYHKPSGMIRGNEDQIRSSLKLLENLTNQYRAEYSKKTGLPEATIEANWVKGDVWLSAKEAKDQKFITSISKDKAEITPDQKALFTACGAPKTPRVNTQTPNIMNMKILAQNLGLSEDATEEQINAKVLENKKKAETAEKLEKDAKVSVDAQKAKDVDDLIKGAVTAKKLDAKQAESLRPWANADFESCKTHIEALKALEPLTKGMKSGGDIDTTKGFEALTLEEQAELAESDPKAFTALYEAYLTQTKK